MLQNAQRDRAQFAWIPMGDTCAFCLTLGSRGWQNQSKKAMKNGHAEHIHANCDCQYAVRFDGRSTVEGYDPEALKAQYDSFEGKPREKINAWRREKYAANPEKYRELTSGATNEEIARKLFISVKTVESYRAKIMNKLGLKTRAELVEYALKKKLL